jgi:predicted nucleic acid-binding Zn ribbon protein
LGHLKDLEISKYERESKGRMAIQFIVLFLLIVVVFGFLNIKSVQNIL